MIGIIDADFIGRNSQRFPNLASMKLSAFHKAQGDSVELYAGHIPEGNANKYKFYKDYSIGFLTRGCFRGCGFCINKNSRAARPHSPLAEFHDQRRKKICLLDDNFLACSDWRGLFDQLVETGKPFQFRQGLDERLLTHEKCAALFGCKYDGDYIFAFDSIDDRDLIVSKLHMIREHTSKPVKFYVLCGYDPRGVYDDSFFENDIINTFERINILQAFGAVPYIMRFNRYEQSRFRGMYVNLARWCNQPSFYKKKSFLEFVEHPDNVTGAAYAYFKDFMGYQSYLQDKHITMKFEPWEKEQPRRCSECGDVMHEGFCINEGCEYYCSKECLHKHYTEDEYNELYDADDAYWTTWYDELPLASD